MATLENGTWHFEGFVLNSYSFNLSARGAPPGGIATGRSVLPYLNDNGAFSISVQDCNVTITAYEPLSTYYPHSGWLNYTVIGQGKQAFDLHFPSKNFYWNITIDGELKTQNEIWSSTNKNSILVDGAKNNVSIYYDSIETIRDNDNSDLNLAWLPIIIVTILAIIFITAVLLAKQRKTKVITYNM